jgi:hypothetical protein
MIRASDPRAERTISGVRYLPALALLACAGWLHAQYLAAGGEKRPAEPASANAVPQFFALENSGEDAAFEAGFIGSMPRGWFGVTSSALPWNQSLYEAFQPRRGSGRLAGNGERTFLLDFRASFSGRSHSALGVAGGRPLSAPRLTLPSLYPYTGDYDHPRFNSTVGILEFSPGDGLAGRGNAMGRNMGLGPPLATFTTPNLGSSLMNFSAATYMGGPGMGSTASAAQKHAGPSISLRLNF